MVQILECQLVLRINSARVNPSSELCGPNRIAFFAPCFDLKPCIAQTGKPVLVRAFVSELPIEALDKCVLSRFSRINEMNVDIVRLSPAQEDFDLSSVHFHNDLARKTARL